MFSSKDSGRQDEGEDSSPHAGGDIEDRRFDNKSEDSQSFSSSPTWFRPFNVVPRMSSYSVSITL
jgi:hypothetical protein